MNELATAYAAKDLACVVKAAQRGEYDHRVLVTPSPRFAGYEGAVKARCGSWVPFSVTTSAMYPSAAPTVVLGVAGDDATLRPVDVADALADTDVSKRSALHVVLRRILEAVDEDEWVADPPPNCDAFASLVVDEQHEWLSSVPSVGDAERRFAGFVARRMQSLA